MESVGDGVAVSVEPSALEISLPVVEVVESAVERYLRGRAIRTFHFEILHKRTRMT